MKKILALATAAYAQDCCPRSCPTDVNRGCCQRCPTQCIDTPKTSSPIRMTESNDCKQTKMEWTLQKSCAPITQTEILCSDKKGAYWHVPNSAGMKLWNTFPNSFFENSPFNLKTNDILVCRVRSWNRNGAGQWSALNEDYVLGAGCESGTLLPEVVEPVDPIIVEPVTPPPAVVEPVIEPVTIVTPPAACSCKKTCKVTGCGGCCGSNPTTRLGTDDTPHLHEKHKHEYCHVHPEDQNRKIQTVKWKMVPTMFKKMVVKPVKVTEKVTVFQKQKMQIPRTKFVMKEYKERVSTKYPVTKNVTSTIMVDKVIKVPETSVRKVQKQISETKFRDVPRSYNNITMVLKNGKRNKITYSQREITDTKVRMVKRVKRTRERVPATLDTTLFCPCYAAECACLGEEGCNCCYPDCGCAPKTIEQFVEKVEVVYEPEEYNTTRFEDVPTLSQVDEPIYEPVTKTTTWMEKVPYIVKKNIWVNEPFVKYVSKTIQAPKRVTKQVMEMQDKITYINKEYRTPVTTMVSVMVDVPVEVDETRTIQQASIQMVKKMKRVPQITEQAIPDPPCHWHELEHWHGVQEGKLHKHNI